MHCDQLNQAILDFLRRNLVLLKEICRNIYQYYTLSGERNSGLSTSDTSAKYNHWRFSQRKTRRE